jgi:hypothetical protein
MPGKLRMLIFSNIAAVRNNDDFNLQVCDYEGLFGNTRKETHVSQNVRVEPQQATPDYDRISQLLRTKKDA